MIDRYRNNFFFALLNKIAILPVWFLCSSLSGALARVYGEADETGESLDLSSNFLIKERMQKSLQYLMNKLLRIYAKAWHGDYS